MDSGLLWYVALEINSTINTQIIYKRSVDNSNSIKLTFSQKKLAILISLFNGI